MNKLKTKLFIEAAKLIETGEFEYACCAISEAECDGVPLMYKLHNSERDFFASLFNIQDGTTFDNMYFDSFKKWASEEELRAIRVMALCLAAVIADEQNKQK